MSNENHGIWIPKAISSRTDLRQTAKMVYGYVNGFTANGLVCTASNKTIGEWVGTEADAVSNVVAMLVEKGLLTSFVDHADRNKRTLSAKQPTLSVKQPTPIGQSTDTLSVKQPTNNIEDNIVKTYTPLPPKGESAKDDKTTEKQATKAMESFYDRKLANQKKYIRKRIEQSYPIDFLNWWQGWKHPGIKAKAFAAWQAAIEIIGKDKLLSSSQRYWKSTEKQDWQYGPVTWVEGSMWNEPLNAKDAAREAARLKMDEIKRRDAARLKEMGL